MRHLCFLALAVTAKVGVVGSVVAPVEDESAVEAS